MAAAAALSPPVSATPSALTAIASCSAKTVPTVPPGGVMLAVWRARAAVTIGMLAVRRARAAVTIGLAQRRRRPAAVDLLAVRIQAPLVAIGLAQRRRRTAARVAIPARGIR